MVFACMKVEATVRCGVFVTLVVDVLTLFPVALFANPSTGKPVLMPNGEYIEMKCKSEGPPHYDSQLVRLPVGLSQCLGTASSWVAFAFVLLSFAD